MQRRIDAAFDFIERVLERPERYPDEAVPFLMDTRVIASMVAKERLHLIRELQATDYASIMELARSLKRDMSRVREDVLTLERLGLVRYSKVGN